MFHILPVTSNKSNSFGALDAQENSKRSGFFPVILQNSDVTVKSLSQSSSVAYRAIFV